MLVFDLCPQTDSPPGNTHYTRETSPDDNCKTRKRAGGSLQQLEELPLPKSAAEKFTNRRQQGWQIRFKKIRKHGIATLDHDAGVLGEARCPF